jgi:hypothetical protein
MTRKKSERALLVAGVFTGVTALPYDAWAHEDEPPPSSQAPVPTPVPPPSAAASPPPPAKEPAWYERVNMGAFTDISYGHNWRGPRPNEGANQLRAFDGHTGFGLTWVGLDASVDPAPVGAQLQLRFGSGARALALNDAKYAGLNLVQNANVSWRPGGADGKLTLVLGKFDTVFGAEVPQSQLNINYTRGLLYTLAQPFFHTGLRAEWQATDQLVLKLLVVNGWNATIDNNRGKSVGGQVSWSPSDKATLSLGYMGGPEEDDVRKVTCNAGDAFVTATGTCAPAPAGVADAKAEGTVANGGAESRMRHLADLVVDVRPLPAVRVVANGTYVLQRIAGTSGPDATVRWYGAALLGHVDLDQGGHWGLGARGEVVSDPDGQTTTRGPLTVYSGTLTLENAISKMLLVRLDNRVDAADSDIFSKGLTGSSRSQITTTLGVVVKTN